MNHKEVVRLYVYYLHYNGDYYRGIMYYLCGYCLVREEP